MSLAKNNISRHVGFIPDGNRRWAIDHRLRKEAGYSHGINCCTKNVKNAGLRKFRLTALPRTTPNGLPFRNGIWPAVKNGSLHSDEVSRLDLIVRWGGGRRSSGFLPLQSVYADFYVRDEYWPDFDPQHFEHALDWFKNQDQALGGQFMVLIRANFRLAATA